jgi:uncharacterized protein (DUF2235 family)
MRRHRERDRQHDLECPEALPHFVERRSPKSFLHPGIGTIGMKNPWQRVKQQVRGVFGLATGYGLDTDVLEAYRFLCAHYEMGDTLWLFGFSRGAYTVRVLAALLHVIGLLPGDQANLATYALTAYKASSADSQPGDAVPGHSAALEAAWDFARVAGARPVRTAFVGVWDTVASVIVPRDDVLLPTIQTLRFTRTNPSVRVFRQAIAIDERRRMFRLNRWIEPQIYRPDAFSPTSEIAQDVMQVWFAGVHADIGGGYPEAESGASKYPLAWMVAEAVSKGLLIDSIMFRHLVLGEARIGGRHSYAPPSATATLHNSLTPAWWVLEWLPKSARWREWPARRVIAGWYLPRGEPRILPDDAILHESVVARLHEDPNYTPGNLPSAYATTKDRPLPNSSTCST